MSSWPLPVREPLDNQYTSVLALAALDAEVGESELLMSVAPIRLMCAGGCVAIKYFHVRGATKDVDCMLDPNVDAAEDYRNELLAAIRKVADRCNLTVDWMNDELKLFINRPKRLDLFLQSIEQNIVIYPGSNIVVYAADLEWSLERKLRRIEVAGKDVRTEDLSDAVAIVRVLKNGGPPLSVEYLSSLNYNGFEFVLGKGIETAKEEYERVYGEVGIAEMVWDENAKKYRYVGLDNKWHWV